MFLLSITKDRLRKSMHLDSRYAYTNYKYVKFCDSAVVRSRDGVVVKVLDSQLQYTVQFCPGAVCGYSVFLVLSLLS